MERDTHYFWVGLFVLGVGLAGVLLAGVFRHKAVPAVQQQYDIHFATPLEGLDQGSEVRYMGIKVGEVSRVFLVPNDAQHVGVSVKVDAQTPVNANTVATLRTQGLMGLPFVNLTQRKDAPPLPNPAPAITVIPSQLSDLDSLMQSVPDLQQQVSTLLNNTNALLNAENRQHVANILANVEQTTAQLPTVLHNFAQTSSALQQLTQQLQQTLAQTAKGVDKNLDELQTTLRTIQQAARSLDQLTQSMNQVVQSNAAQVDALVGEGGESLKQLLREANQTAGALHALSDSLQRNPSQLLYQPAQQGTELPP